MAEYQKVVKKLLASVLDLIWILRRDEQHPQEEIPAGAVL
jgi:hypothetical protein